MTAVTEATSEVVQDWIAWAVAEQAMRERIAKTELELRKNMSEVQHSQLATLLDRMYLEWARMHKEQIVAEYLVDHPEG